MKNLNWFNKVMFFFNIVLTITTFIAYVLPFLAPKLFPILSVLTLVLPLMLIFNLLFFYFGLMVQERMNLLTKDSRLADLVSHGVWNTESLEALKLGKFNAPLDSLSQLSTYLEIEQKKLVLCVMRVFYPEQLSMLVVR